MTQHIDAIYEHGILKPLEPLNLTENQRVRVSVSTEVALDADIVARQRQAMEELDAIMDTLPDNSPDDGFSAADHDKLLYGDPS